MRIADVLRNKGAEVATIAPDATVAELLDGLAEHNIGAMVVVDAGAVAGIVSERDVVRKLHEHGPDVLGLSVAAIMTTVDRDVRAGVVRQRPDRADDREARPPHSGVGRRPAGGDRQHR